MVAAGAPAVNNSASHEQYHPRRRPSPPTTQPIRRDHLPSMSPCHSQQSTNRTEQFRCGEEPRPASTSYRNTVAQHAIRHYLQSVQQISAPARHYLRSVQQPFRSTHRTRYLHRPKTAQLQYPLSRQRPHAPEALLHRTQIEPRTPPNLLHRTQMASEQPNTSVTRRPHHAAAAATARGTPARPASRSRRAARRAARPGEGHAAARRSCLIRAHCAGP